MKVESSLFLQEKKPALKALVGALKERYAYASVLATDSKAFSYSTSKRGVTVQENGEFTERGFVVRVYDGTGYGEYSFNEITEEDVPKIVEKIASELIPFSCDSIEAVGRIERKIMEDTPESFVKSTEYQIHPAKLGNAALIDRLQAVRKAGFDAAEGLLDVMVRASFQEIHKLFLSPNRDLEQNILWMSGAVSVLIPCGQELRGSHHSYSVLGGAEVLDQLEEGAKESAKTSLELVHAEPMVPGEYECVCTPSVTGMIVHEAFGHGVEMDMFVKDRALAKYCIGEQVASPIVSMHDSASCLEDAGTYFFDDEGVLSTDTLIIDHGILKTGISDALSADSLGTAPTGNGRRESFERKAYTRMTNTIFTGGTDTVEDMIKSVKYGMLLAEPTSGMEDPKNWGIQMMVNFAREIRDGKLTGRIFTPIVLTGYVPDLLKSITMMSSDVETSGSGYCGKGYKEWVKVSDGGPWIKAKIRLG